MSQLCEEADCDSAVLLDARDPGRLYMWLAGCPGGPSVMFRVLNTHTVNELNLDRRRACGARNLLVFDSSFESSAALRVMKALLTQTFAVPVSAAPKEHPKAQHTLTFSWLDGRIWLRVYRIIRNEALEKIDVAEIGPRMVLEPVRIIASSFGGAVLYSSE